jgi:hypothetical protein
MAYLGSGPAPKQTELDANTVETEDIKDGAVTGPKLAAGAVDLSTKVDKAGDTMTGALVLSGNPVNNLEAAPKQYVDSAVAGLDLSTKVDKAGDTMTGSLTVGDQTGAKGVTADGGTSGTNSGAFFLARTGATPRAGLGNKSAILGGAYDAQPILYFNGSLEVFDGGTKRAGIDGSGNLQFNSGYGSVATAYGCRAWVNFNGTGTVAIRASGNVSSITDNGTGDYTVNFTTAMPNANYCAQVTAMRNGDGDIILGSILTTATYGAAYTTSSVRVVTRQGNNTSSDALAVNVSVFR